MDIHGVFPDEVPRAAQKQDTLIRNSAKIVQKEYMELLLFLEDASLMSPGIQKLEAKAESDQPRP